MKKEFENIEIEARGFIDRVIKVVNADNRLKELYRGAQVYFSPIREKPEIMFLGINPGAGYYNNNNNTPVYKFDPPKEIEYLAEYYSLADEWKYVFGEKCLKYNDGLKYALKTNCFYIATKTGRNLDKFIRISREHLNNEIVEKSRDWTKRMIKAVSPKILICEGFSSFNWLKRFYGDELSIREKESEEAGACCKCARLAGIVVLGFARVYSRFKNIDVVIDKIDEYL